MSALPIPFPTFDRSRASEENAELFAEIAALREENALLRGRDTSINAYMNRLDEEMRLAARLQRDFLPKTLPTIGNVRFQALFRPAGYVSGDLYDVMRLDEENVGFYLADAVGHGMPAALLTMFIKNALVTKEIIPDGYRLVAPSQAMSRVNDTLVAQNLSNATFATAIYGRVNTTSGQVMFARGGHPLPVVLRADGSVDSPDVDGCLLGIFENETFPDCVLQLHPGDRMFVFSDGIEVCFNGEKITDTAMWQEELRSRAAMTTGDILAEFDRKIEASAGSLDPKDDLTMIVIEMPCDA